MSDAAAASTSLVTLSPSRLRLALAAEDPLSAAMADGAFEVAELAFAVRTCRPGDVVVDAGAHVGLYTVHMAQAVGPEGRVYAFEPTATSAACLRASVAANQQAQVTVVAAELGSVAGAGVVRLDQIVTCRPVSFIKLDVEGAEWNVLEGSASILVRDRPVLLCEIDYPALRAVSGVSPEDLFGLLRTFHYQAYEIDADGSVGTPLDYPPTARASSVAFVPSERDARVVGGVTDRRDTGTRC